MDAFHTKCHVDWLWHSGNIKVITSVVGECSVLVLLMMGWPEVASCVMMYTSHFMAVGFGIQVILWPLLQQFEKSSVVY
jgi:hypothetical protein